ncbi:MAG: hypothetical protein ACRENE_12285 [Polyangiaceae bacterium]
MDLGPAPELADLELLRRDAAVDAATRARVRARLAESVLGGAAMGAAAAGAPRVVPWVAAHTYWIVAAAFLVGAATGAAVYARLMPRPEARVVLVERPAANPAPSAAPSPPAASSPPEPTAAAVSAPPASAPAHGSGPSQLSVERHMLDEARHALLQGNPTRALEVLERHRRTFPSPLLAEEHGALEVQSLAKAERYGEARTLGEAFRRRYPDSLYLPMVDAALAAMP